MPSIITHDIKIVNLWFVDMLLSGLTMIILSGLTMIILSGLTMIILSGLTMIILSGLTVNIYVINNKIYDNTNQKL